LWHADGKDAIPRPGCFFAGARQWLGAFWGGSNWVPAIRRLLGRTIRLLFNKTSMQTAIAA